MKHLELHIIQSVPVSCLNRDDFGSPKTAVFGGNTRARISSQCWKRAIRNEMKSIAPRFFKGERTKLFVAPLAAKIQALGVDEEMALKAAKDIGDGIAKLDKEKKTEEAASKVKTLFFTSPAELEEIAQLFDKAEGNDVGEKVSAVIKALKAGKKKGLCEDAADVAIFGRMVASLPSMTIEGAAMFNHALSTHRVSNEIDFFAAVDDLQPKEELGAGMTETLEYNAATYYRFAALNMDMLFDQDHLGALPEDDKKAIVKAYVQAVVTAVPAARRNSMNANTMPSYVLAVIREQGHPIQLVNAFEKPVTAYQGSSIVESSIQALKDEYQKLKDDWGIQAVMELSCPESVRFKELVEEVADHVH